MNVNRPSEHDQNKKIYLENEIRDLIRSEWPFVLVHFASLGFFAAQYFRASYLNVQHSEIGRWIFLSSGLLAFGMIFWTGSTLKTILLKKWKLRRLERANSKLIG